jgi:hypothetical protein
VGGRSWRLIHEIGAPRERVEQVLLAPDQPAAIPRYMPQIAAARLLERKEGPGWVERAVWFQPGFVPPLIAGRVPMEWLEWVEHTRFELATHEASFRIEANLPARLEGRFGCSGRYWLEELGRERTRRGVEGTLRIDAPPLSSAAERLVIHFMGRLFAAEAHMLEERARRL